MEKLILLGYYEDKAPDGRDITAPGVNKYLGQNNNLKNMKLNEAVRSVLGKQVEGHQIKYLVSDPDKTTRGIQSITLYYNNKDAFQDHIKSCISDQNIPDGKYYVQVDSVVL